MQVVQTLWRILIKAQFDGAFLIKANFNNNAYLMEANL